MTRVDFNHVVALIPEIHAGNVAAGWWSDLTTGASILSTHNRAELMMLVISELVEASDGQRSNLMDDKLPQYPMWDVELADAAIRLMDMLGAERPFLAVHQFERVFCHALFDLRKSLSPDDRLFTIVRPIGHAMEHHRKGRLQGYVDELINALVQVFVIAKDDGIDLIEVIEAKRRFNASREDHKIENRMKPDGKKY